MRTVKDYGFVKRYEEIESLCSYWIDIYIDGVCGSGADIKQLDEHYHAEQHKKEAKMELARRAEENALRQERGFMTVTHNINPDSDIRANPGFNPDNFRNVSESTGSSEALQLATEIDYSGYGGASRAGQERSARNDTSSATLSTEENGLLQRAAARAQTLFRK